MIPISVKLLYLPPLSNILFVYTVLPQNGSYCGLGSSSPVLGVEENIFLESLGTHDVLAVASSRLLQLFKKRVSVLTTFTINKIYFSKCSQTFS